MVKCSKTARIEVDISLVKMTSDISFDPISPNTNQGDYDINDYPTNCHVRFSPTKITSSSVINTVLCRSQHYSCFLSAQYSGFAITATQAFISNVNNNSTDSLLMTVGICNSSVILTSNTFSISTIFSLLWNGTLQKSVLNANYCLTISSLLSDAAMPISIEFQLMNTVLVLEYSSISVANKVMFETDNLLVVVDLRDQWNNTIESPVEVADQDGNIVGTAISELKFNATLIKGQFVSKKTLYLVGLNESYPHTTFYGTFTFQFMNNLVRLFDKHQ